MYPQDHYFGVFRQVINMVLNTIQGHISGYNDDLFDEKCAKMHKQKCIWGLLLGSYKGPG